MSGVFPIHVFAARQRIACSSAALALLLAGCAAPTQPLASGQPAPSIAATVTSAQPSASGASPVKAALPAAAPALPDPASVSLDRLGLMQGFPPAPDQRVDVRNSYQYPQLRWTVQHLRELQPTQNISRGSQAARALPQQLLPLGQLVFNDPQGQATTIDQWADATYTDALLVLHKGKVVYERYLNQMQPASAHLLFSVTKSFTGLLAAQLAHEGKINPDALVTTYVPELKDSAWGDMTVRHVMDMTGAVRFREAYTDPSSEIFGYAFATGLLQRPPQYQGPSNIYDFLKTLKKEGEHGEAFIYRTVHSEVLGWIISRVTGQRWTDVMSARIWSKLGMQDDAYVMVDSLGTPLQGAGMNASARDLAKVGEMLRLEGRYGGQQILSAQVIQDIRQGGDRTKFNTSGLQPARPGFSYRNQWWVLHNADGAFEASGIHGQFIHVNPGAQMVIVKLSSHPVASANATHPWNLRAWAALADALRKHK